MANTANSQELDPQFSLVMGGPLYRLFVRTHMVDPPTGLLHRRIIAGIALTWIPLALITLLEGTFSGGVKVPFLQDLGNLRFLIILPMLLASESTAHRRIRKVVEQFNLRHLISDAERPRFDAIVAKAMRLRNSFVVEALILLVSYTVGHWIWHEYGSLHMSTWYSIDGERLTYAGYWNVFVSLPAIRFILLRWYFRLFIWYLFLWKVRKLDLNLNSLHPDRAGGLGFLGDSIVALTPVLFAQSCFFSAQIGNDILHKGVELQHFQALIIGFVAFLALQPLLPLLFVSFQLAEARIAGMSSYGGLASRYTQEFRQKWIAQSNPEQLLGTADIQSLADLANSFDVVRTMRLLPFDKRAVLRLIIILTIPILPLMLSTFSLAQIAQQAVRLLL